MFVMALMKSVALAGWFLALASRHWLGSIGSVV